MDDTQRLTARLGGRFLIGGGVVLALVTWGERFVGPLVIPGQEVVLDPVPARVLHLVSYPAILFLVLGAAALGMVLRGYGRAAVLAAAGVGLGFALGALPHTVLDWAAIPAVFDRLPEAEARELVMSFYGFDGLVGPVAMVGMLGLVLGTLTLGILGLRRDALPRGLAWASVALLPASFALEALNSAFPDAPIPHSPVLFDLLVVAYGWQLLQQSRVVKRVPTTV